MEGTVRRIFIDEGYGFITVPNRPDCFFHCRDLADDLLFDEKLRERRVQFELTTTGKGPRATNVKPV